MKIAMMALTACVAAGAQTIHQDQSYKIHILQDGETLSELLHEEGYTPLYGKDRWVEKILLANHLTMEQAKDIKKGRPIILPSKEILMAMSLDDEISVQQSAISHGLFGNKISKHQNIQVGFQYHVNSLKTEETDITSQENYGLFLSYQDRNFRSWKGLSYNPEVEVGTITHGTNQTNDDVISYDPTFVINSKVSFRAPSSTLSVGPAVSWESASRGYTNADGLGIRRDHLIWAGAYAANTFNIPGNIQILLEGSLQRSVFSQENSGLENLEAYRSEMAFGVNLTKNYFLRLFSKIESFQNANLENSSAAGARLSYQIQ